jgi:hypothetical protein
MTAFPLLSRPEEHPKIAQIREDIEKAVAAHFDQSEIDIKELYDLLNDKVKLIITDILKLTVHEELSHDEKIIFLNIGADEKILLEQANVDQFILQLKKQPNEDQDYQKYPPYRYLSGSVPETFYHYFKHYDKDDNEVEDGSLFTQASKIVLIREMLVEHLDIAYLIDNNYITAFLVLPRTNILEEIQRTWTSPIAAIRSIVKAPKMEKIKNYFGIECTIYLKWLVYTLQFSFPTAIMSTILGIIFYAWNNEDNKTETFTAGELVLLIMAVFTPIGATVFDQTWRRKQSIRAWHWGTIDLAGIEYQDVNYQGTYGDDPITGKYRKLPNQTRLQSQVRKYAIYTIMLLFLLLIVATTSAQFYIKDELDNTDRAAIYFGIGTSVLIKIYKAIFSRVAIRLTNWENNEFYSDYVWSLAFKLFCFEFINNYASLFYIAFFKGRMEGCKSDDCLHELTLHLSSVFTSNCAISLGQILVLEGLSSFSIQGQLKNLISQRPDAGYTGTESQYILQELDRGCIQEYMDIVISYGYIQLFGCAFPFCGALFFVYVLMQTWIQPSALCKNYRRPYPRLANSIGVWGNTVQVLSIVGAVTNSGIILFTTNVFEIENDNNKWLLFVILQNVLICFKLVLDALIVDQPNVVKNGVVWGRYTTYMRLMESLAEEKVKNQAK